MDMFGLGQSIKCKVKHRIKNLRLREYSTDVGDPYYPVPNQRNRDLYKKYQVGRYPQIQKKTNGLIMHWQASLKGLTHEILWGLFWPAWIGLAEKRNLY